MITMLAMTMRSLVSVEASESDQLLKRSRRLGPAMAMHQNSVGLRQCRHPKGGRVATGTRVLGRVSG